MGLYITVIVLVLNILIEEIILYFVVRIGYDSRTMEAKVIR